MLVPTAGTRLAGPTKMETTTAPSTTPAPDDPTDDGTWIGGCALYVCGSIIINFGHCVIRLSHVKAEDGTSMWTNLLWVGGFMLFASGDVVNIAGLNMAAQSLLEALGSVQFISYVPPPFLKKCPPLNWLAPCCSPRSKPGK